MKVFKTQKRFVLIGCSLHIMMSTTLYAQNDLDDLDVVQHVKHYNSLPSVEESTAKLQESSQFAPFLKEAEEIVKRFQLDQFVGLRLIHRHYTLDQNQVMAEAYKDVNKVPSLVTSAYSLEDAREFNAAPASWIFGSDPQKEVLLFENSSDPAVKSALRSLSKSPEFFDEIGTSIRQHRLQSLLSVAILQRDLLPAKGNQTYLEVNNSLVNKSVVQICEDVSKEQSVIPTSWSFHEDIITHRCKGYSYCQVEYDGKHVRWYHHDDVVY